MRQPEGRAQRRGAGARKPREERWTELLATATDVFHDKGYEAASLQDIAERLGMLKGSLYYYITSKEDLLYNVLKTVYEGGLANVELLAASSGGALERLRRMIIGHIEYECEHLRPTSVFHHELGSLPAERSHEITGGDHAYRSALAKMIEVGQSEGMVRPDLDPTLAALGILGAVNWVYRWFRPDGDYSPTQIGTEFADMAVRGIATPAGLEALASDGLVVESAAAEVGH